jgi:hypothetical protein
MYLEYNAMNTQKVLEGSSTKDIVSFCLIIDFFAYPIS